MGLLARVLPLGLASTISPTMLVFATLTITTYRGKARLAAYILGWTLAIGAVGVLVVAGAARAHRTAPGVSGIVDLTLAALALLMAGYTIVSARRKRGSPQPPKQPQPSASRPRLVLFFGLGIAGLLTDISSLIPYVAAVKEVGIAGAAVPDKAAAAFLLWFLITLPLLVPLAIVIVAPSSSQRILDPMQAWLKKHGVTIAVAVLLAIAAYLLVRGGLELRWW